jgi:hypothetical protein
MRYKIILVVAILIIFPTALLARIIIPPIRGPIIKKISVFVPDLTPVRSSRDEKAREFVDVLRNDLINAALFDVHNDTRISGEDINLQPFFEAGAEALIKGEYQALGDTIKGRIKAF